SERLVPGLGNTTVMKERMFSLFPEKSSGYKGKKGLLIKGKFVVEVNQSIPFGVFSAIEVNSVTALKKKLY
ncbi:MAG: hypothetical protein V1909_03385, partial [Candidatus Micrarchaeota archaeon]